jgi:intein/homing endonuclease
LLGKALTPAKGYVIGACLGDNNGTLNPRVGPRALLRYKSGICAGKDKDFAEIWSEKVSEVYGINPVIRFRDNQWYAIISYNKHIWEDLRNYAVFGTYHWRISKELMSSSADVATALLRGYFDAEACVCFYIYKRADGKDKSSRGIRIETVNQRGLSQIFLVLKRLGIHATMHEYTKKKTEILSIHRFLAIQKFHDLIGFGIRRKQRTLENMIAYFSNSTRYKYTEKEYELAFDLAKKGLGSADIARKLGHGLLQSTVWSWLNGRQTPLRVKNKV